MKKTVILLITLFIISFINNPILFAANSSENSNSEKPNIYSNSVILEDGDTGAILFNKNANQKVYPASTTKILTAIIAIENLDMSQSIVISKNAVYSTPAGSSTIALQVGEILTVKDLLYGLLLNSGNDAANVLAENVSGNIEDFVKLMNNKAKELGCTNSHFANAHGFHDANHYTTAADMMKIYRYALQNSTFREICETKTYTIDETNKTKEKRYLSNTNKLIFTTEESYKGLFYQYAVSGKTGYTIEARGTFVGCAKKGDSFLILGTFDGAQNISGHEARFLDAVTLFNYGFDNCSKEDILDKTNKFQVIDKANKKQYTLSLKDNVYSLKNNSITNVNMNYSIDVDFNKLNELTPLVNKKYVIQSQDSVGKINYNVDSNDNSSWALNSSQDLIIDSVQKYVDPNTKTYPIKKIAIIVSVALILLLIVLYLFSKLPKNKKPRKTEISKRRRSNKIDKFM